jgi:DNA-binding GntR family transcriptional regulator
MTFRCTILADSTHLKAKFLANQNETNIIDNSDPILPSALSEDDVLRLIEQAVMDHRLPPGTKLKEVELAQVFGVKRGAIRKVLTRLVHSRLADQQPNKGVTVAKPSVKEAHDLFSARRAIECSTLESLAAKITVKQIKQLRKMLDEEQSCYQEGDSQRAIALSIEFHQVLASMADNDVMTGFLNDIIRRTPLVILTHLGDTTQNHCRNQEHDAIVDALENGDGEKAGRIMGQHLSHIENRIKEDPQPPKSNLAALLLKGQP